MKTRYWDTDRGCWAYGESIWDGRALPFQLEDERYWAQAEAMLGQGDKSQGGYPTVAEMSRVKIKSAQKPMKRRPMERCPCGRVRPVNEPYCKRCARQRRAA